MFKNFRELTRIVERCFFDAPMFGTNQFNEIIIKAKINDAKNPWSVWRKNLLFLMRDANITVNGNQIQIDTGIINKKGTLSEV